MPRVRVVEDEKMVHKPNPKARTKIRERRATKAFTANDLVKFKKKVSPKKRAFEVAPKWWKKESIGYAFCHSAVRTLLERLMGTNLVRLLDREYMQRLQERILENCSEAMDKRIKAREADEMERVKNLVLTGIIPLKEAPECMSEHPVLIIENYCNKVIAHRRAHMKKSKRLVPQHNYYDDTPDPPSGLAIENGHIYRGPEERLCHPVIEADPREKDGYMYSDKEFGRLLYETPLIKQLRQCETVEEMYLLADEIIGLLKTVEESRFDTFSVATTATQSTFMTTGTTETKVSAAPEETVQPEAENEN